MGYRGLHLQHVLTWTPKVAKATSVAANEEGCYGDGELSTCLALTGAHHTGKLNSFTANLPVVGQE